MGAWGVQPWDSDEAADWFGTFMEKVDLSFILETVNTVSLHEDDYDQIRAVSYILEVLGKAYIWPPEYYEELDEALKKMIALLEKMIEPDSEFLELWENDKDLILSVKQQIDALKQNQ